jgi:hypothetical protein
LEDDQIFEAGKEAYWNGWSNIPPASIASIRLGSKDKLGTSGIWMEGWQVARQSDTETGKDVL